MAGSFIASSNQNAFVIPASGLNGQYVIGVNPLANSSGEYDYQGINTFRTGGFGYAFGSEGGFTLMGIDENGTIHGNGGALTNIPASGIAGGFNTNILVGGHTFYITNGIIMNIQ